MSNQSISKDGRNYGIDALRIVAMIAIVMIHILYKGGLLTSAEGTKRLGLWLIEICGLCAVNCYAMISGYVMYTEKEKPFRYSRYIDLWLSGFMYSAGITVLFFLLRIGNVTSEVWSESLLPVGHNTYWYLTAYTPLFFIMPWLNKWIRALKRREMTYLVLTLFLLFSFANLLYDQFYISYGYSFLWLMILYLFGAWIKKCDVASRVQKKKALGIAVICVLFSWIWFLYSPIRPDLLIKYNSPTTVIYAASLLVLFSQIKPGKVITKGIMFATPAVFGVYLIHEHPLVRTNFENWFSWLIHLRLLYTVLLLFATVLVVFIICILIEKVRLFLYGFIKSKILMIKNAKRVFGKL